ARAAHHTGMPSAASFARGGARDNPAPRSARGCARGVVFAAAEAAATILRLPRYTTQPRGSCAVQPPNEPRTTHAHRLAPDRRVTSEGRRVGTARTRGSCAVQPPNEPTTTP